MPSKISSELIHAGLMLHASETKTPSATPVPGSKPNILFVLVDEMRFPSVFPTGIDDAAGFLRAYMPNLFRLWQNGVKFSNYHTASSACTPARGTLFTGLYSQQTWLCCTLTSDPTKSHSITPQLDPAFPTFGKLLREAGYQTPYIGKWHVSCLDENKPGYGMEEYGFDEKLWPDPIGFNLQGTIGDPPQYLNDKDIASAGVAWLQQNSQSDVPWCLTVSFVNPHDKEFFWAGTEFQKYNELMEISSLDPATYYSTADGNGAPPVPWSEDVLKDPPAYGYPAVPPNWESAQQLLATKPTTQSMTRAIQQAGWGGASDDPAQTDFTVVPYPKKAVGEKRANNIGIGTAPFSYWSRSLDCYTQTLAIVDERIGEVLDALPVDVANNTVIVFASDHGDYAGAHGFLSGKIGTAYKEVYNVPLIVADPSGRFTAETEIVREGLVSSVDMLRMFVSFGHNGGQKWLTGDLATLYGNRLDILPMLKSAKAPGRDYLLIVTDEIVPGWSNYNDAPIHIIGLQTKAAKLGTYAHWVPGTDTIRRLSVEAELYDYGTARGRAELDNLSKSPVVGPAINVLFDHIVPNELRAPLPVSLLRAQEDAKEKYVRYEALALVQPPPA